VLFLSNVFPTPFDHNRGQFNLEIVQNLRVEHEVRVVCPVGWTDRPWRRAPARGPAEADHEVEYVTYYYVPRIWYFWRDVFMWWSIRASLRALTRAWRPDVLLAFWTHPDGDVARRLAAELGVPFVQIVGGSDVLVVARGLRRKKVVRTLLAADSVIAIGRDLGRSVQALGVHAARITSVYLPVAPGPFVPGDRQEARRALRLPADKPVVLWVGRFVPVKGLDVLVSAVRRLAAAVPDVHVYLVGDGPDLRRTRALVGREGLDDVVQFVGPVRHDLLGQWYRAADVTALSSHSEGVPNVLLESIACGTPFVGTSVGGVPEIADLSVDRLVAVRDPEALAHALADALARRSDVGRAGRTFATPQGLRDQFKGVFERATEARLRARSA
jgi:glycosyltransferase involved in cell wall biosynthesis